MDSLGKRVRARRTEMGWDQEKLAMEVRRINPDTNTQQTTISAIECGKARTTGILVEIAKALGVNEDWLQTGEGPKLRGSNKGGDLRDPHAMLDHVFQLVAGSYEMLGLSGEEASALAALVREAADAPLAGPLRQEPNQARRTQGVLLAQKFSQKERN